MKPEADDLTPISRKYGTAYLNLFPSPWREQGWNEVVSYHVIPCRMIMMRKLTPL
jgi:hypothetical protein